MSNLNIEFNLNFGNVEYILYLSIIDDNLKINLEQMDDCLYWKAEFEGKYIEEITNKAGSYKSFQVFVKMLMSSLSKESESVFIDLLSFKDLEEIKMKKLQGNSLRESYNSNESQMNFHKVNSLNSSISNNINDLSKLNKRYFIMSYTNEFEKVHYPLPLQYVNIPEGEMLQRTIHRMRKQMQSNVNTSNFKSSGMNVGASINFRELEELKGDNINLKNKVKLLESQRKMGAVDNEEFLRNQLNVKEEYDKYKLIAENKVRLLAQTVEELKNKINNGNSNSAQMSKESEQSIHIKELEAKLEKASEIVINERKQGQSYIDEKLREIEKIKKENISMKEDEKKYKVKINQLEKDLESANKRNVYELNNIKNKNHNSTKNSQQSLSVRSNLSNTSSKKSITNSASSNVKQNLLANPYNKYKGLYSKNYTPFKFFDKNKTKSKNSSSIKSTSVKSIKLNSSSASKVSNNFTSGSKNPPSYYTNSLSNKIKKPMVTYNNIPKVYTNKNSKITNQSNKFSQDKIKKNNFTQISSSNTNINNRNSLAINATRSNNYTNSKNLIEEKTKIINRIKTENESSTINANDINERLGRIQNLLDSAKA